MTKLKLFILLIIFVIGLPVLSKSIEENTTDENKIREYSMNCGQLYNDKKYEDSAKCLEDIINKYPDASDIGFIKSVLAGIYADELRNYSKCIELENEIILKYNNLNNIEGDYKTLAECYRLSKEYNKELEIYNIMLKKNISDDGYLYIAIGTTYHDSLRNSKMAIKYYNMFLEKYPKSENANGITFVIAEIYEETGNNEKALEYYRKIDPDYMKIGRSEMPRAGDRAKKMEMEIYYSRKPGEIAIFIDSRLILTSVPPVIRDSRVLVPLRGVFEEMDTEVSWIHSEKKVIAKKAGKDEMESIEIILKIGNEKPTVNGKIVPIDVPAMLIKNRTYIPLRFVSESLGAKVRWDEKTKTVYIDTK